MIGDIVSGVPGLALSEYLIGDGPSFVIAADLQNQSLHFGQDPHQAQRFSLDDTRRIVQDLNWLASSRLCPMPLVLVEFRD